jgi:GR25 family glycosyltransferase involved in LPS biosynthesis
MEATKKQEISKSLIIVICSKDYPERTSQTLKYINGQNCKVKLIEAIYPSSRKIPFRSKFDLISDGELGCLLSHRKVWKQLKENNGRFIILEDDIKIAEKIKLEELQNKIIEKTDVEKIIFFGAFDGRVKIKKSTKFMIELGSNNYNIGVPYEKTLWCTYGYSINKKGAEILLKCTKLFKGTLAVDSFIKYIESNNLQATNILTVVPNVVFPRGNQSTIRHNKNSRQIRFIEMIKKYIIDLRNEIAAYCQ